jgi:ABC-type multidrug transport system fused ATPase/permease subunit
VDGVLLAAETGLPEDVRSAMTWLGIEGILAALLLTSRRCLSLFQDLLRALLSQRVNVLILEKAVQLDLVQFEDSEIYDKMTRARREASSRPLSLVKRTFNVAQNFVSVLTYGGLLLAFSGWAVVVLALTALPAVIVETHFARSAFRIFRWRTPETRQRYYLEAVIARDDYAKEVQLFGLGPMLLGRYEAIFHKVWREDRDLTVRRSAWGTALSLLSTTAFYGVYAWIVWATIQGRITLGDMTMYLVVFRQGQNAFSQILADVGGMYEDNLYLSTLYEFLDEELPYRSGTATVGTDPADGLRFEGVSFTYPGAGAPALSDIDLHIRPGSKLALVGPNGSGKTTLIKLLTRLYEPDEGRISLDGLDLREWDRLSLHRRMAVIFQDFVKYQLRVGENVGVGDVRYVEDEQRWEEAADRGMARSFIETFPERYHTQLGRWFPGGREMSIGQWQKVALSRAFMRDDADILVLDEPTAAMDAEAEARIFERVRAVTAEQIAILISHRFSTVRMADHIVVMKDGLIVERGSHDALMEHDGTYAHLFRLQARGYR